MSTAIANSTTPRVTYESPCGRVKVVREGPKEFWLHLDGICTKSYPFSFQAEHDGGVWLHEQAQQLTAQLADEQAERDAYEHYEDSHTPEKAAAILLTADPIPFPVRLTEDGTPNKYDTGEYSREKAAVRTPIATLSDGTIIQGTHDVDGSPYCIYYEVPDGYFFVGDDGHLAGEWDGMSLEIEPETLPKLRALFTSNITPTLQDIARLWAGDENSPKRPESPCTHLQIAFKVIAEVEKAARQGLTRQRLDQLTDTIAVLVDSEFGIVDFTDLPALEAVCIRREAGAPSKQAA